MSSYEYRMHSPAPGRNARAFDHIYKGEGSSPYDSRSSYPTTADLSEYISSYTGPQYFHPHGSIDDSLFHGASPWPMAGDLSLDAHNIIDEDEKFFVQPEHRMFASTEPRHGHYHPSQGYGVPESVYNPSYPAMNSAMNSGGHAENSAGQSSRATQSPPPRPRFPKLEPASSPLHLPEATAVQDFVSMNESFIPTNLPENSPFALARTEEKEKSDSLFPGYSYPGNHQWPQTFKISEIKQIGPKKQRLACFFCRSRKIACATRAVDDESGRPCEQCERRGFECKYPKDSKRGQHNRIKGFPAPKSS